MIWQKKFAANLILIKFIIFLEDAVSFRIWSDFDEPRTFINDKKERLSAYRFKVNGTKHQGFVFIVSTDIEIFTLFLTASTGRITNVIKGVCIENLIETLIENVLIKKPRI